MKNFYLKHRILTVCFFFTIFIFLIINYIGIPLIKKVVAQADYFQEDLLDLEIVKKRTEKIPQMEEDKKEIDSQKEVLNVVLHGNEVNFIERLEIIAQETGNEIKLEINDMFNSKDIAKETRKKKKEGEEGILEKINYDSYFLIKINLTGSYENLVNFIHIFENDQFYVNIFSVNIQKIQKEELNLANGTEINSQSGAEAGVLRENPFLDFPISEDKNSVQAISEKIEIVPEKKEFLNSSIEAIVYKRK
ncbi:MAG: hypothetical protein CO138_01905 [Candidatus Moranbacteria bacterium CG_4_9_14_3_um_filter_33_15]|nr:MAG: hypothetical protein CO138_01905 [Candidatus Moranbacteria bacterium CG_4_9_14_3_um_filter_33_15]